VLLNIPELSSISLSAVGELCTMANLREGQVEERQSFYGVAPYSRNYCWVIVRLLTANRAPQPFIGPSL
jgi:hypothetical protein